MHIVVSIINFFVPIKKIKRYYKRAFGLCWG